MYPRRPLTTLLEMTNSVVRTVAMIDVVVSHLHTMRHVAAIAAKAMTIKPPQMMRGSSTSFIASFSPISLHSQNTVSNLSCVDRVDVTNVTRTIYGIADLISQSICVSINDNQRSLVLCLWLGYPNKTKDRLFGLHICNLSATSWIVPVAILSGTNDWR